MSKEKLYNWLDNIQIYRTKTKNEYSIFHQNHAQQ